MIISFTKSSFVERDLIFSKPSFVMCLSALYKFFICWTSIKLLLIHWFGRFFVFSSSENRHSLYSVISRWNSLYVLRMNWFLWHEVAIRAPVSQVQILRLCAIVLERRPLMIMNYIMMHHDVLNHDILYVLAMCIALLGSLWHLALVEVIQQDYSPVFITEPHCKNKYKF